MPIRGGGWAGRIAPSTLFLPLARLFADLRHYSNVLAPGPLDWKAVLSEADVKLLANSSAAAGERIKALSNLTTQCMGGDMHYSELVTRVALPLFATRPREQLLCMLAGHATGLQEGYFKGTNGPSSYCVVGPRGIGKTNLACAFTAVCGAAYPSVIPLYVSGKGYNMRSSSFAEVGLEELIRAAAAQHGVVVQHLVDLTKALQHAGKQMLIIVDEVEQLYRVTADDRVRLNTISETLGMLDFLGNTTSGIFGTLVCGSAAATPMLIYGKGADVLGDTYPLLRDGVPDLNCTKYMTHVIAAVDGKGLAQVEGRSSSRSPPAARLEPI